MSSEFVLFLIFLVLSIISISIFINFRSDYKKKKTELTAYYNDQSPNSLTRTSNRELERYVEDAEDRAPFIKGVMLIITGITVLLFIASVTYFVPVNNVGIVTAFKNPTGRTTGGGLKIVAPWQQVADFDASVQTIKHVGDKDCSTVRIGSLATACVENVIQWKVKPEAAPSLYRSYKGNFDNLKNNLVETQIQNALNYVFATYNPLSLVNLQTGVTAFDGSKLGDSVRDRLVQIIGNDIEILTVSVPFVHHDPQTEQNIKAFQDVIAQSRILDQAKANADKEKQVAATQQSYLTQEFLQNKCIEQSIKLGFAPGLCLMQNGIINTPTTAGKA